MLPLIPLVIATILQTTYQSIRISELEEKTKKH
jgi:hypothetical protein